MRRAVLMILAFVSCVCACTRPGSSDQGFTVTLDACLDTPTKADVSARGKLLWRSGDAIAVYNTQGEVFTFTLKSGEGTPSAVFECTSFKGTLSDVAVFPAACAGASAGVVNLPSRTDYDADADFPVVMAASVGSGPLHFRHLCAVVELVLEDIPAYVRAVRLCSLTRSISGSFGFDRAILAPITAREGTSGAMVCLPLKAGYKTTTTIRFAVPASDYTDLRVSLLDGDGDPVEGVETMRLSRASSSLKAGDYVTMPAVNIRSRVTRPEGIRKVEGISWTSGNLIYDASVTGEGFQDGWSLATDQWKFVGYENCSQSGGSFSFVQSPSAFDRFAWGGIGSEAIAGGAMTPAKGNLIIQAKIYEDASGTSPVDGDARFATDRRLWGDLAFWASRGRYCMPTQACFTTLRAGTSEGNANARAGYVMEGGHRINGMLFTSTADWESSTLDKDNPVEFTPADLESGLFLPKTGRRFNTDATGCEIKYVDNQGYYWSSQFNPLDGSNPSFEHCARGFGFRQANSIDYGYTTNINKTNVFDVEAGLAIRPIVLTSDIPDPEIVPSPKAMEPWKQGWLDIHLINSGRGECNFVILPDGTTLLIDAGEYGSDELAVARKPYHSNEQSPTGRMVRPFKVFTAYMRYMLSATTHNYLDYCLVTHFHQDHAGQINSGYHISGDGYTAAGPLAVYDDLPIHTLIDRIGPPASGFDNPSHDDGDLNLTLTRNYAQFASYRSRVDGMKWQAADLTAGGYDCQIVPLYDKSVNCSVKMIGGNGRYFNGSGFSTVTETRENGKSLTCLVSYGSFNAYFAADCSAVFRTMQCLAPVVGKVELYKAAHHLYKDTFSADVASHLQPQTTVAHVLSSDRPSGTALEQASRYGKVFCTNVENGAAVSDYGGHIAVRVYPDGKYYVYKLRDTDFSYEVLAVHGPYASSK